LTVLPLSETMKHVGFYWSLVVAAPSISTLCFLITSCLWSVDVQKKLPCTRTRKHNF